MFEDTHITSATDVILAHKKIHGRSVVTTWLVGFQVNDELDGVMASSSNAVSRTTRESPVLETTMRSRA